METNQHSPVPWAVGSNNGARPHIMDADGKAVAMITPRREAWNGDLLAAAPELLELAQQIVLERENSRNDQIPDDIYQGAVRAIAKAKGEIK